MNNIFHVIKDPVHGTMQFTSIEDAWIKPFVDSANFQRLRHIKQMGMGDYIFPGAVHSRFNHSLGCCYVASQIAHKIGLADEERQLVMIACLLHDIGHGPFSHTFEDLFSDKCIRHEDWTPYFLNDYSSHPEFFTHYNRLNPRYHLHEDKFRNVGDMIMHNAIRKSVLSDIVSSQLDADRLDYLLRDSHFCGVTYGEFDFRWMLHCLAIVQAPDGSERLGITHKGIGAVEHYLMARRLMIHNIYKSQKKLALEHFMIDLLTNLSQSLADYSSYATLKQTRLGKFMMAANEYNHAVQQGHQQPEGKRLFLEENYHDYKELCDYDVFALIKYLADLPESTQATQIALRLHARMMPKIIRLDYLDLTMVTNELAEFKQQHRQIFQEWQLKVIQTPHRAYSGGEDPILVINEHKEIKPITHFSFMINAISDKLEHVAFLCIDKMIADDKRITMLIDHLQSSRL